MLDHDRDAMYLPIGAMRNHYEQEKEDTARYHEHKGDSGKHHHHATADHFHDYYGVGSSPYNHHDHADTVPYRRQEDETDPALD